MHCPNNLEFVKIHFSASQMKTLPTNRQSCPLIEIYADTKTSVTDHARLTYLTKRIHIESFLNHLASIVCVVFPVQQAQSAMDLRWNAKCPNYKKYNYITSIHQIYK